MKCSLGILEVVFVIMLSAVWQVSTAQPHKPEKLSKQQLFSLIASAKTPSEYRRVAEYYHATAQDYLAQAKEHEEMAEAYKKNPMTSSSKFATGTVEHCGYFAQSFKEMATKMQELADIREQMAKDAVTK